jgi:hypothetical protein
MTTDDGAEATDPIERLIRLVCPWCSRGYRRLRREVDEQIRADRARSAARRAVPARLDRSRTSGDEGPPTLSEPPGVPVACHIAVAELALPDYDHLPASQIVAMLSDLDADERDQIEGYERVNRNRRTVLGKLAQLRDTR